MARVDRLDPDSREVLRAAAVVGRSFFHSVLRELVEPEWELVEPEWELDRCLEELTRLELIREQDAIGDREYAFKHAITHDVVYESILHGRRRELHRRVATLVEQLYGDRLEEVYGLLAYHHAQADDPVRAHEYLLRAGDQAARLAADAAAIGHYEQAVRAYEQAFGDSWDSLERAELDRKIGEAFHRLGNNDVGAHYLTRGLDYLGYRYPASRWGVRRAILRELSRQIGHRVARVSWQGRRSSPASECVSQILNTLSWIHYFIDRERLVLDALLQLNRSERNGVLLGTVRGASGLGVILDAIPARRLAGRYHRRAVRLAADCENPSGAALAYLCLAHHEHHVLGSGGFERYEEAASAAREAADLRVWGAAIALRTTMQGVRGELAHALAEAEEMVTVGGESGDAHLLGWGEQRLGAVLRLAGVSDEAEARLSRSIPLLEAVPDLEELVHANALLGRCLLEAGLLDEAVERLEDCEAQIAEQRLRGFHCTEARLGLAEAYLSAAEHSAGDERRALLAKARGACRKARKQSKLDRDAGPAARRLTGTYLRGAGRPRRARRALERSLTEAQRLGARYDLALTLAEIGRATDDSESLARGLGLLDEIRAAVGTPSVPGGAPGAGSGHAGTVDARPGEMPS
jgi:tetratricopeptide (TPR) repeat protein